MNNDHWAVVIGIRSYPGFGADSTKSSDLRGPDNDVRDIKKWLEEDAHLPAANILCDHTSKHQNNGDANTARPNQDDADNLFDELYQKCVEQGKPAKRLYVYVSGHGYAPDRGKGCLFVANSTQNRPKHIFTTDCADWFFRNAVFEELILWYDCCMDRQVLVTPRPAGFKNTVDSDGLKTVLQFYSFAAKFSYKAVERKMEKDGAYHGVFTHTLLKGLRGGATDEDGNITTRSLQNFLKANMKAFMSEDQINDREISKEPDFLPTDDIIIVSNTQKTTWPVTIKFPTNLNGQQARVFLSNMTVIDSFTVSGDQTIKLPTGIYVLDVVNRNVRETFEVLAVSRVVNVLPVA